MLFSDRAQFAHDIIDDRDVEPRRRSTSIRRNGGTALYDATWNALMRLRGIEGRRVVVRDDRRP